MILAVRKKNRSRNENDSDGGVRLNRKCGESSAFKLKGGETALVNIKKQLFFLAQVAWVCGLFLGASCQERKTAQPTNIVDSSFYAQSNGLLIESSAIGYCNLLKNHSEYEEKNVELKTIFVKGKFVDVFYDENCVTPNAQVRVEFTPDFECAANNSDDPNLRQSISAKAEESEKVFKKFKVRRNWQTYTSFRIGKSKRKGV